MLPSNDAKGRTTPFRRLPSIRGGVTLVWIQCPPFQSSQSKNKDQRIILSRTRNNYHILRYTNISRCIKYLKQARSYERIIVVLIDDDSTAKQETSIVSDHVLRLDQYRQVRSIFIVSSVSENDTPALLSKNAGRVDSKTIKVFHDHGLMLNELQQLMAEVEQIDEGMFTAFDPSERALQDVRYDLGAFVWSHSYRVILEAMPCHSFEAKQEMLAECRAQHRGNHQALAVIDEFGRLYRPINAAYWYTKPCFLYRLVNKALRTGDIHALYIFRYFIVDLCTRLEELTATQRCHHTEPFCVYRGATLDREEIETLRVAELVATNGFLSCSYHLDVAEQFIGINSTTVMSPSRGRQDKLQYVLFEIKVDFTRSPNIVVGDVSCESAVPDENEMIFTLGTTFIITHITYDVEHHVWRIQMISSSQMSELNRKYDAYIRERLMETNGKIMYGSYLAAVSSDYTRALGYFHRLLRKTSVDEDRPNIYYHLGRVYRYLGKYEKAIMCFRGALLLQKRRLPEWKFDYARTIAGLGTVYSELSNSARAVHLYEKAMAIHRSFLPADHLQMGFHSNRLAYAYWQDKQYDRALKLLSSSLSFFKHKISTNQSSQAKALHTMGLVQHALCNRKAALDYFKQALYIRESLLPKDHPSVARTCYDISVLYADMSDEHATALDYAQRALGIRQTKLPQYHKDLQESTKLVNWLSQEKSVAPPH